VQLWIRIPLLTWSWSMRRTSITFAEVGKRPLPHPDRTQCDLRTTIKRNEQLLTIVKKKTNWDKFQWEVESTIETAKDLHNGSLNPCIKYSSFNSFNDQLEKLLHLDPTAGSRHQWIQHRQGMLNTISS
jgi:hypothetical protein